MDEMKMIVLKATSDFLKSVVWARNITLKELLTCVFFLKKIILVNSRRNREISYFDAFSLFFSRVSMTTLPSSILAKMKGD